MIYNYIALGLAALFLVLSIICVIAENFPPRQKFLRRLLITLREVSKLPFVIIALIVLYAGSKISGAELWLTGVALGIFFAALIILHWFRITSVLRSRKGRKSNRTPLLPVGKSQPAQSAAAESKLAPLAKELQPMEPQVIDAAPSES